MLTIPALSSKPESDKTLADQLLGTLIEQIVTGSLQPGAKLSEPELARKYEVSRGPLREAIRRLQSKRLVEVTPNSGARVVAVCRERLVAVYQTREALEGMAARLFAERFPSADASALLDLLTQHKQCIAADQGLRYVQEEGDLDFHYQVAQGSGNESLIAMLCDDLYYLVRMYRHRAPVVSGRPGDFYPERVESALKEHFQIAEAIVAGDGELAELLTRRHISKARELAQAAFLEEK